MHTLYVARDKKKPQQHDLGSVLCLRMLDLIPHDAVDVQDCDGMRSKPQWLTGTPTLTDAQGQVYRGHQALSKLQHLAVDLARPPPEEKRRPAQRPQRLASAVQLREEPHAAPSAPPDEAPPDEAPPDQEVASLWDTRIDETEQEDELSTRKVTTEDLARAVRDRATSSGGPADARATAPQQLAD